MWQIKRRGPIQNSQSNPIRGKKHPFDSTPTRHGQGESGRRSLIPAKNRIGIPTAPRPQQNVGIENIFSYRLSKLKIRDFSSTFLGAFGLKTPGKVEANLDSTRLLILKSRKVNLSKSWSPSTYSFKSGRVEICIDSPLSYSKIGILRALWSSKTPDHRDFSLILTRICRDLVPFGARRRQTATQRRIYNGKENLAPW